MKNFVFILINFSYIPMTRVYAEKIRPRVTVVILTGESNPQTKSELIEKIEAARNG